MLHVRCELVAGLEVTVLSGRSLRQGVGKEAGKNSDRYRTSVNICEMNPEDISFLLIKSGDNVKVTTRYGSVVLKSSASNQLNKRGLIFIPYGPYANRIVGDDSNSSGMPTFKGVQGSVVSAVGDSVKTIEELVADLRGV